MHRQYKLNQQAAQTDPLMTGLSLSAQGHVRLSPLIQHRQLRRFLLCSWRYYITVRITTPKKNSVRKLQREIDQISRSYDRDVESLTQKGESQDEIQSILQNAAFETDMAQEQIQIILSARLFHEANRLGIPSPRYTDPDSNLWERSYRGHVQSASSGLSTKLFTKLLSTKLLTRN